MWSITLAGYRRQVGDLVQLQIELIEQRYTPLPVRNVTLYKGQKVRVIALYSMRDKIVQHWAKKIPIMA